MPSDPTVSLGGIRAYLVTPDSISWYDDLGDYEVHDLLPDGGHVCKVCQAPVGIPLVGDTDTPSPVRTVVVYGPTENEPIARLCDDCGEVVLVTLDQPATTTEGAQP